MSALAHSRPFDLEAARAGAPYSQSDGDAAEILKWDMKGKYPLMGCGVRRNASDEVAVRWYANGTVEIGFDSEFNLVMLPLGLIDGKPAFVGDTVQSKYGDECIASIEMEFDSGHWRWPAPAKMYPETKMCFEQMCEAGSMSLISTNAIGIRQLANAVLRHAIDAGQVTDAANVDAKVEQSYVDGQAFAYRKAYDARAERDMAIAKAVRDSARDQCGDANKALFGSTYYGRISNLDLAAIIASLDKSATGEKA